MVKIIWLVIIYFFFAIGFFITHSDFGKFQDSIEDCMERGGQPEIIRKENKQELNCNYGS